MADSADKGSEGQPKFQAVMDLIVIWVLRGLQILAIVALVLIGLMGFLQIGKSVAAIYHGFDFKIDSSRNRTAQNLNTTLKPDGPPANVDAGQITSASIQKTEAKESRAGEQTPSPKTVPQDLPSNLASTPAPAQEPVAEEVKIAQVDPKNVEPGTERAKADPERQGMADAAEITRGKEEPIHMAFQGLELLLMAPLFYLLLRSLSEYVVDLRLREELFIDLLRGAATEGSEPQVEQTRKAKEAIYDIELGKISLLDAKALSFGLLFGIVATHLVGKLISGAYEKSDFALSASEIVLGAALLIFIAATYFGMETLAGKMKMGRRKPTDDLL